MSHFLISVLLGNGNWDIRAHIPLHWDIGGKLEKWEIVVGYIAGNPLAPAATQVPFVVGLPSEAIGEATLAMG